jgi:hypothetical protein
VWSQRDRLSEALPSWTPLNTVWPPFLLGNLSPTDSASLADYLPYLNLLQELLSKQADQILPHLSEGPVTISIKTRGSCSLKGSSALSIGTSVDWPSSGHPHNTHHCQAQRDPPVAAPFKNKTLPTNFRLFHYSKGWILISSCWAPHGYTSPANSLSFQLLHKLLVLIWLSIGFPFTDQKSSSCDPCVSIAQAGSIVTKTLLFHTYYSCAGSVIGSCTLNHTIYQVCSHDNQFTCFNPTYRPVEQWLELRSGPLAGNIVTQTQVFDPEKPVSLLFDACAAID